MIPIYKGILVGGVTVRGCGSYQEYDSFQPTIVHGQRNNEESHAQEDGHASDQVDEVTDFLSDGCFARFQTGGQVCNTTHDGTIARVDDDAFSGTLHGVGREEGQIFSLQRAFVCAFDTAALRFRLSSQGRVIDLKPSKAETLAHLLVP